MENTSRNWSAHIGRLGTLPPLVYEWEKELCAILQRYVRPRSRVVELGCSNGRWVRLIAQRVEGIDGHGIDFNDSMFSGTGVEFALGDVRRVDYPDNSFDFVFSLGLVEHFSGAERTTVLREHARIARPGGHVLVVVPIMERFSLSTLKIRLMELSGIYKGPRHFSLGPEEISAVLEAGGCSTVDTARLGWLFRWRGIAVPRVVRSRRFATEWCVVARKGDGSQRP